MTYIFFFIAIGLSFLLAGRAIQRRAETTIWARVKYPARIPSSKSKDQF